MTESRMRIDIEQLGRWNWQWTASQETPSIWRPKKTADGEPAPPPNTFMLQFRTGFARTRSGAIKKAERAIAIRRRRLASVERIDK